MKLIDEFMKSNEGAISMSSLMIDEMKEEKTNQSLINGRREAGWWSGAS
eukprot:UN03832